MLACQQERGKRKYIYVYILYVYVFHVGEKKYGLMGAYKNKMTQLIQASAEKTRT